MERLPMVIPSKRTAYQALPRPKTRPFFFNTGSCEAEEISEGRELIWDAVSSPVAA